MEDYADKLLKIAQKDLDASYVLYENRLYMQSIYMFQQAIEKSIKYFGLIMNIVMPEELHDKIGHKSITLFTRELDKQMHIFRKLKDIRKDKNIGRSKLFSVLEVDESLKKLEDSEKEIKKLCKENIHQNREIVIYIYNGLLDINDIKIKFFKNLKNDKDFLNNIFLAGSIFKDFASRVTPFNAKKIQLETNYLIENEKRRNIMIDAILKGLNIYFQIDKISRSLFLFSLLTANLDTRMRYPANEQKGELLTSFTKKDTFINILPDFQHELHLVIEKIRKIKRVVNAEKINQIFPT